MVEKDLAIAITELCNKSCEFCYTDAKYASECHGFEGLERGELTTEQWLDVIDQAIDAGFTGIHIYGGEPFMRPDLKSICWYASNKKTRLGKPIRILIATNGSRITESDLHWIKETNSHLSITINEIQQPNPFLLQIIHEIVALRIPFVISTCLTASNIGFYDEFINSMNNRYGAFKVQFFGIYFSKIGRGKDKHELLVEPNKWLAFRTMILEKYDNVSIENIYGSEDDLYSCPCGVETGKFLVVGADGDLFPCLLLLNNFNFVLGNLKRESLKTILGKLSKVGDLRKKMLENCKDCKFVNECEGGCLTYCRMDESTQDCIEKDYRCKNGEDRMLLYCPLFSARE